MKKRALLFSVFLLLIFFNALPHSYASIYTSEGDTARYLKNAHYHYQVSLYDIYLIEQADIVMLGNSITHGVNWNDLLGRTDIVERGIVSDGIEGFLNRLEYVTKLSPKYVFIMGGINDIYAGEDITKVIALYKELIDILISEGITPVIQSTLYVAESYYLARNNNLQVTRLNNELKKYAEGKGLLYIDLNKRMSSKSYLKEELTRDGVHLNAAGYKIWRDELIPVLNELDK
jgi:lysophospholipase L1-like esterase